MWFSLWKDWVINPRYTNHYVVYTSAFIYTNSVPWNWYSQSKLECKYREPLEGQYHWLARIQIFTQRLTQYIHNSILGYFSTQLTYQSYANYQKGYWSLIWAVWNIYTHNLNIFIIQYLIPVHTIKNGIVLLIWAFSNIYTHNLNMHS